MFWYEILLKIHLNINIIWEEDVRRENKVERVSSTDVESIEFL